MNIFKIQPVEQRAIDKWKVEESGLSARVVNSVNAKDVVFVGDLRPMKDSELLKLRSLGRISLTHIHDFFKLCNKISSGNKYFENIKEVLEIFLDEDEFYVLSCRYGLERTDLKASRNYYTLQQIGNERNRTRERVRQVEEASKINLNKNLATVCLRPFVDFFRDYIDSYGKCIAYEDLRGLFNQKMMAGLNPCSTLLLLADLFPDDITFHNNFFSTLPQEKLENLEKAVLDVMGNQSKLFTTATVQEQVADAFKDLDDKDLKRTLDILMQHKNEIAATISGEFFQIRRGIDTYMIQIMQRMKLPSHYRDIADEVNKNLMSSSRQGPGIILKRLNAHPQCFKAERGIYTLHPALLESSNA